MFGIAVGSGFDGFSGAGPGDAGGFQFGGGKAAILFGGGGVASQAGQELLGGFMLATG